jgi:hypothetical protein
MQDESPPTDTGHEHPKRLVGDWWEAGAVAVERCDECGFDGSCWSDDGAVAAITELPARRSKGGRRVWRTTSLAGGRSRPCGRSRSIATTRRQVRFEMRFMLDVAVADPGTDLGPRPEPRFDPESRAVDVTEALAGISHRPVSLSYA